MKKILSLLITPLFALPFLFHGSVNQVTPVVAEEETIDVHLSIDDLFNGSTYSLHHTTATRNENGYYELKVNQDGADPYVYFKAENLMQLALHCSGVSFEYKLTDSSLNNVGSVLYYLQYKDESDATKHIYKAAYLKYSESGDWNTATFEPGTYDGESASFVRWDYINSHVDSGATVLVKGATIHDVPKSYLKAVNITNISIRATNTNVPSGCPAGPNFNVYTADRGTLGTLTGYFPIDLLCYDTIEKTFVDIEAYMGCYQSGARFVLSIIDTSNLVKDRKYYFTFPKDTTFDGNLYFEDDLVFTASYYVHSNGETSFSAVALSPDFDRYGGSAYEKDFTNNGQFTISGGSIYSEADAQANNVPSGYDGVILKTATSTNAILYLDYSDSKIPVNLITSLDTRFYTDEADNSNTNYPQFRLTLDGSTWLLNGGSGGQIYNEHCQEWYTISVNDSSWNGKHSFKSLANENGFLGSFQMRFRTANSVTTYVDYIKLVLKDNDGVAPVITLTKGDSINVPINGELPLLATAYDAQEDRNIEVEYISEGLVGNKYTEKGSYDLVVKATDYYGNVSQKTIHVNVGDEDHTAPVIDLPFDEITLATGTYVTYFDWSRYISDEYEFTFNVVYSSGALDASNRFLVGDHTVTITATDSSGNVSNKILTIHIVNDYVNHADYDEDFYYQEVRNFIATYLHMNETENNGYCADEEHHYYETAKEGFNALSNNARIIFATDNEFIGARARLQAWAKANGEVFNGTTFAIANSLNQSTIIGENQTKVMIITITIITVVSLSLLTFLLVFKKRKMN